MSKTGDDSSYKNEIKLTCVIKITNDEETENLDNRRHGDELLNPTTTTTSNLNKSRSTSNLGGRSDDALGARLEQGADGLVQSSIDLNRLSAPMGSDRSGRPSSVNGSVNSIVSAYSTLSCSTTWKPSWFADSLKYIDFEKREKIIDSRVEGACFLGNGAICFSQSDRVTVYSSRRCLARGTSRKQDFGSEFLAQKRRPPTSAAAKTTAADDIGVRPGSIVQVPQFAMTIAVACQTSVALLEVDIDTLSPKMLKNVPFSKKGCISGIALSDQHDLFLSDTVHKTVSRYDPKWTSKVTKSKAGLKRPSFLSFNSQRRLLATVDSDLNSVYIFDSNLNKVHIVRSWKEDNVDKNLQALSCVAWVDENNLLIVDSSRSRLLDYDAVGQRVTYLEDFEVERPSVLAHGQDYNKIERLVVASDHPVANDEIVYKLQTFKMRKN